MTDHFAELELRLRHVEDLLEIRSLLERYGHYLDHGRWSDYASLFTQDAKLRLGPVRADGRAEIERVAKEQLGAGFDPASDGIRYVHLIGSPQIEVDGDRATSEAMWTVINRGQDGRPVVTGQGHHIDNLVRENGRWRFQSRRGFYDLT